MVNFYSCNKKQIQTQTRLKNQILWMGSKILPSTWPTQLWLRLLHSTCENLFIRILFLFHPIDLNHTIFWHLSIFLCKIEIISFTKSPKYKCQECYKKPVNSSLKALYSTFKYQNFILTVASYIGLNWLFSNSIYQSSNTQCNYIWR